MSRTISMDAATAAQAAAAGRRADLAGILPEDDSLMMCLIAEFGESFRLVADVFNSLRRLDGTYLHHRVVANRVRSSAERPVLQAGCGCSGGCDGTGLAIGQLTPAACGAVGVDGPGVCRTRAAR